MLRITELKKKGAQPLSAEEGAFNKAIDDLEHEQFVCVDDLWERIGPYFDTGVDSLIASLPDGRKVSKEQLIEILAEGAREPESISGERWVKFKSRAPVRVLTWPARFLSSVAQAAARWPELLAVAILLILAALALTRVMQKVDTVTVRKGLPAFHVLKKEDLEVTRAIGIPGSLTSTSNAEGHYLLQQVAQGARLYASQISKVPINDAAARNVFSVPVKAGSISPTLAPPDKVSLLFSPRRTSETNANANLTSIDDVIVLSVNRQGDSSSIVVALKGDPLEVAKLLVTSDVMVVQRMSR